MALKIHAGTKPGIINIGDLSLHCAVLEDKSRVLSHRGITKLLGGKRGASYDKEAGAQVPRFLTSKTISSFVPKDLSLVLSETVIYDNPHGGGVIYGIHAKLLPDICDVWLKARLTPKAFWNLADR